MAESLADIFETEEDVAKALAEAEENASSSFEMEFVESFKARFEKFGMGTYVSDKQWAVLTRLINKHHR